MADSSVVPIARGAKVPSGLFAQLSRSDTPRWTDGRSWPDEYAPGLIDPIQRMKTFDEMRSDDAINTPLTAREQLILSSNWMLSTADESDRGREILEFCEDNLYPLLDAILRQLAGAIQYGFAAFEPIFVRADQPPFTNVARGKVRRAAKSRGRLIYLQRIARIRQRSVWSFRLEDTGELRDIEQYVFTGGVYQRVYIPPEKVLLWVYRQRGDDHWGYPPTRSLYWAWDAKRQLERLMILGFDRFGVGTPVITGGQDWTDADFEKAFEFLQRLRSGATTGLVAPFGGTANMVGGQQGLAAGFLDVVKWYSLACAKTFLTQGTELGSTQTGARAVGETMYDQMESVVQADCEEIAQLLNEQLLVRLVQWNFGPQEVYPAFNPSQRVRDTSAIATVIQGLVTAKALKLDAKDEAWLRDQLGMHDIDVEARQAELDAEAEAARAATEAVANAGLAGGDGTAPGKTGQAAAGGRVAPGASGAARASAKSAPAAARRGETPAVRALSAGRLALTPPDPAMPGMTHRTAPYATWEQRVVKPVVLGRALDLHAARLTAEVQAVLAAIDVDLAGQVDLIAAEGGAAAARQLDTIRVPDYLRLELRQALLAAAVRAQDLGARAVDQELQRQQAPDVAAPARAPHAARRVLRRPRSRVLALAQLGDLPDGSQPGDAELAAALDPHLVAQVLRAVEEECARREQAARAALTQALATAPQADPEELAPIAKARAAGALEELSPARTQDNVQQVVNAGFGQGRRDALDQAMADDPERIAALVYSAILDGNTCEECARWDGAMFPPDYDQTQPGAVKAPNPRCAGGARCRCIWVAVMADEAPAIVGPSKGPLGPGEQP